VSDGLDSALLRLAPFGILVFDRRGRLSGHNPASERLLGPLRTAGDGEPPRCCDLLGCRRPGSALAGTCILDLAHSADGPLPEIRIDLAPDDQPNALWITVAPLEDHASSVLVTLRPGQYGDRRRRTDPHWISSPRLSVVVLGRTALASRETPLGGQWLHQRPGQLFKYLIVHRDRLVPTEELAETFWPESAHAAVTNVRYFIHVVREQLEPQRARRAPSAFVVAENGGYRLDRTRVVVDADRFEALASAGLAAAARGDPDAPDSLTQAAELYEGEFLAEDPYAEWALSERDRLRTLASDALRALAGIASRAHHLDAAGAHLGRLAKLEPFDVSIHRELLALLIRRGRYAEAERLYASLRVRMRQRFGEELDFTLAELAERPRNHGHFSRYA
jgi:DNA-binding SARP family transcriptional activator